jgi:Zn-dependent protease/predicted transcriptional regulator
MGGSLKLFRVSGIDIRMHITFPLILIYVGAQFGFLARQGFNLNGAIFGVIVTLILFAIVVLHELGHSLTALTFNVPVEEIVLFPIGGVAKLARIPEEPIQEFLIAIAGPAVNFAIAIVMAIGGLIIAPILDLAFAPSLRINFADLSLVAVFNYVFISNLFLGVFNLLPAFPMDGGRILRSLLATRLNYRRATRIAVAIGQSLAWLLGLLGFLQGNYFLIIIAIFIYLGAGSEERQIQLRSVLGNLTVEQVYSRQPQVLHPDASLQEAVALTLNSFQSNFPICDGEQYVGILTHTRLVQALDQKGPDLPVSRAMQTDIQPAHPTETVFDVQQRMAESKIDALPVTEAGRLLGILTAQDINEAYRLKANQPDLLPVRQI